VNNVNTTGIGQETLQSIVDALRGSSAVQMVSVASQPTALGPTSDQYRHNYVTVRWHGRLCPVPQGQPDQSYSLLR
jgi:hypothetical protein